MDSSTRITILVLLANVRASHPSVTSANGCISQRLEERQSKEMIYKGCFERACFRNESSFNISTIDDCTSICKKDSHLSAALEFGDTCYCGIFACSPPTEKEVCDSRCGIPCSGHNAEFCGGRGFLQVYKQHEQDEIETGKEGRTGSESWLFLTVAIVGVLTTAVVFICLGLAWTKRRMRSQDRREQPVETHQTSGTSRRRRPQLLRRSLSDYRHVNPSHANTDNSTPPVTAQLSSNNTYDHTLLRDGIRMNAGNSKPTPPHSTSKVPNCAQSSHNHRKFNDRVDDSGDVCSGVCCSASKNGVECCCHNGGRHFDGRPSDETASSTASYFSLEPHSPKMGIAARFKMVGAVKPQRGKMDTKRLGCSPNKVAEDDSYAYAMCDDQDLDNVDNHYYCKANTVIQEEVYELVADFKSQHKNHEC